MKSIIKVSILCFSYFSFISCRTNLDVAKNSFENKHMSFKYRDTLNEFDYYSQVLAFAHDEYSNQTHFSINLPKGLQKWSRLGFNKFYFEYPKKQIIAVVTKFKEDIKPYEKWELKSFTGSSYDYIQLYWKTRNYNEKSIFKKSNNRITMIYTNGNIEILLYNIKLENFPYYLKTVKSFKIK